jgi:hypothetical protein
MSSSPKDGEEKGLDPRTVLLAVRTVAKVAAGWKVGLILGLLVVVFICFAGLFMAAGGTASGSGGGLACQPPAVEAKGIPANYRPWLPRAAAKYRLGPRGVFIVAAIHYVESDFGRSTLPGVHSGTNFAGAEGPGQFLVSSWQAYGVDGDGDGVADPYSVPDSIFATANLLHAAGAPGDWHGAIFTYNHAEWYVQEVLEKANALASEAGPAAAPAVCSALSSGALGQLPSGALARVEYVAKWIESRRIHYCWGGGHGSKPGPSEGTGEFCPPGTKGLDCSGSVRWLLVLSGYPDPGGLVSNELGAHYPSGPGRFVTIWSNVDHVWLEIRGRDWGTATANFAHGPAFGTQSTAGFVASHPPGL